MAHSTAISERGHSHRRRAGLRFLASHGLAHKEDEQRDRRQASDPHLELRVQQLDPLGSGKMGPTLLVPGCYSGISTTSESR